MDRGEFAASLSEEQEEFIEKMRDLYIKCACADLDDYKKWGLEYDFKMLERGLSAARAFHFLLNQELPDSYAKVYADYEEILNQRSGVFTDA